LARLLSRTQEKHILKAVIFDLGRVLVGYDHQRTLEATADCCDGDVEALRAHVSEYGHELNVGEIDSHGMHEFLVEQEGCELDYAEFLERFSAGLSRDDQALSYAIELQNRPETTVAVISNTSDGHVRWLDEHLPELKEFDTVVMSNEVGMAKPDHAIYLLILELIDLPAEQAIFIDDLSANVEAACALGMAGIVHVDWADTRLQIEAWLAEEDR
jgi:FMN phosphatase YigB (HAD superfamily)